MSEMHNNKHVLLIGGSQGIGLALVKYFLSINSKVTIFDCCFEGVKGLNVSSVHCNLMQPSQLHEVFSEYLDNNPIVDSMVYCARYRKNKDKEVFSEVDEFLNEINVNLVSFNVLLNQLCHHNTKVGHISRVVGISSIAGSRISNESAAYHASKAGMENLVRFYAAKNGKQMRINAIAPGFIVQRRYLERYAASDNSQYVAKANSLHPLGITGTEEDIVNSVSFLTSTQSRFITGQVLALDGGLNLNDGWRQGELLVEKS